MEENYILKKVVFKTYYFDTTYFNVEMFSMGDQVPLKTMNPQKKRMIMPDIMLYTENIMIPVMKPVPSNQSFNISFLKHKSQIMKAHNYKNNPALLFSKTTLHNPLENLFEVNQIYLYS